MVQPGVSDPECSSFKERLERVEAEIAAACQRAGRTRADVRLMAVSKTHPAEAILEAVAAGVTLFGENRVQEFAQKAAALGEADLPSAEFHLIGHLQSNKSGKAVELFDGIDSLDSLRLAERLNEAAAARGEKLPVLLEIKLSHEETKTGLVPNSAELAELLERLPTLSALEVKRADDGAAV